VWKDRSYPERQVGPAERQGVPCLYIGECEGAREWLVVIILGFLHSRINFWTASIIFDLVVSPLSVAMHCIHANPSFRM